MKAIMLTKMQLNVVKTALDHEKEYAKDAYDSGQLRPSEYAVWLTEIDSALHALGAPIESL